MHTVFIFSSLAKALDSLSFWLQESPRYHPVRSAEFEYYLHTWARPQIVVANNLTSPQIVQSLTTWAWEACKWQFLFLLHFSNMFSNTFKTHIVKSMYLIFVWCIVCFADCIKPQMKKCKVRQTLLCLTEGGVQHSLANLMSNMSLFGS